MGKKYKWNATDLLKTYKGQWISPCLSGRTSVTGQLAEIVDNVLYLKPFFSCYLRAGGTGMVENTDTPAMIQLDSIVAITPCKDVEIDAMRKMTKVNKDADAAVR